MIVFDTSVLALSFDDKARAPIDPTTGVALTKCKERIDYLLAELSKAKQRVLIPTPVLAEYLVLGGLDKDKRLQEFSNSKAFTVGSFDIRAAVECSMIQDGANSKKPLSEIETKAKLKFDRQIIAVAIARGAKAIYTGDRHLAARALENGLAAVLTWDLPLPPEKEVPLPSPQLNLGYEETTIATAEPESE